MLNEFSEFITTGELSKRAGITRATLNNLFKTNRGPIHTILPTGHIRVRRIDGETWLQLLKDADTVSRKLLGWGRK